MVKTFFPVLLTCATLLLSATTKAEQSLKIGVSANFTEPLKQLVDTYNEKFEPDIDVKLSVAATGVLYQQVRHGAPFDMVFAADIKRPQLIEEEGLALENSRFTYATGQLALWSTTRDQVALDDLTPYQGRIAIAAPHLAPYGKASKEALLSLDLWRKFHDKVITGNNISQTYQQTRTGAVDFGIISYSQFLLSDTGSGVLIDSQLHEPIEQQMLILKSTLNEDLARKFQQFILSDSSQELIISMGYADTRKTGHEQQ
ncbi:molybdate ABC transporter substrate-binding protein [Thalassotalea mangrovi]|uniref:Molybdate ABC transporter substrate-binding protein n=1 Tax=Thalassotalea mangrovi TaxID=2572245 RepID=A0A4U1B9F7_9GAMM|nr:molybdate ABC transporter substrate-binding protein [Thalassotalea mangrovi]TKB47390.1 molybdate ABC transporter substrate-binding protein [Thalassotalea mangrovi]